MEHIPLFVQSGRTSLWFGAVAVSLTIYSVRRYLRSRLRTLAAGVVIVKP